MSSYHSISTPNDNNLAVPDTFAVVLHLEAVYSSLDTQVLVHSAERPRHELVPTLLCTTALLFVGTVPDGKDG